MNKYTLVGIILVVSVIAVGTAYFIGRNTKSTQTTNLSPITQPPATTPTEQTQTTPKVSDKTPSNSTAQTTPTSSTITNSQPCLAIANEAAKNEEATNDGTQGITVLQAHYKNNNCYYEFSYPGEWSGSLANPEPPSKATYTVIHFAPNDGFLASCVFVNSQPKSCSMANSAGIISFINEAQFHLIEAQYLTN